MNDKFTTEMDKLEFKGGTYRKTKKNQKSFLHTLQTFRLQPLQGRIQDFRKGGQNFERSLSEARLKLFWTFLGLKNIK